MDLLPTLGRLHPVLNHLPIGIFSAILLLEGYARITRDRDATLRVITFLWSACFAASLVTVFCGWQLALEGGYQERSIFWHRWLSICFTVIALLVFILRVTATKMWAKDVYRALLFVACGVLLFTGHLGGSMTHGKGYLTKHLFPSRGPAPTMVKPLQVPEKSIVEVTPEEGSPIDTSSAPVESIEPEDSMMGSVPETGESDPTAPVPASRKPVSYLTQIQPIFNARCIDCHGLEKMKADLVLETPESVSKGSENGAIYVPGEPLKSPLYTLVNLPPDDVDIMPAKGKPLSEEQIELIYTWILEGASFGKGVKIAPTSAPPPLKAFSEPAPKPIAFELKAVISNLEKQGVVVQVLPGEEGWLSVNFSHANKSLPLPLSDMHQLVDSIAEVNLGRTAVSDEDLVHLQPLNKLVRLNLKDTSISNEGMRSIQSLPSLAYLNLSGTKVTDEGIQRLSALNNLENLYLWNSKVTEAGALKLGKVLPQCVITLEAHTFKSSKK